MKAKNALLLDEKQTLEKVHSCLDAMGVPTCEEEPCTGRSPVADRISKRLDWIWAEFDRIEKKLTAMGRRDLAAAIRDKPDFGM